jgi:hypothetical protein
MSCGSCQVQAGRELAPDVPEAMAVAAGGGGDGGLFGDNVIDVYTRRQAIEDGVLVDVSEMAQEAGIKYPTAVTRAVWDGVVVPDEASQALGQDERGRLWDVLTMFRARARTSGGESELHYPLSAIQEGRQRPVTLKAVCGPHGPDDPRPCITIMMPDED